MSEEKINSMDADIKSLKTEVTRLVASQDRQTEALVETTKGWRDVSVNMARVLERLEHSAKQGDRAHDRLDKMDATLIDMRLSIQNNIMTKEKMIGYTVVSGVAIFALVYSVQRIFP